MKTKTTKRNSDTDEESEGVSYAQGREFEEQFADFLKNKLGWEKVRVGAHMTGKNNAKGTSIDVFAERLDELGIKYNSIAVKWMVASGVFVALSLIFWIGEIGAHGHWFFILSLLSLLGGAIFMLLSGINNKQNAWVECKSLKSRATVSHVGKMIREFEDFKLSKNEDHRFTHYYFASANGYVENALKMAMDKGIICYIKKGNTFEEAKYWS